MVTLNEDWMMNGLLDVEYKQYELLAYLQKVETKFDKLELYPYLSDIISHYDGLISYKKYEVTDTPRYLIENALSDTKLSYEDLDMDIDYKNQLVDFALVEFRKKISLGKLIFDEVETCIDILEIGKVNFNSVQGFFIIHDYTIDVYEYSLTGGKDLNTLNTKLIRTYPIGLHLNYESIRLDLLGSTRISNPSTFIIDTPIKYPIEETLLPITRRIILKKLTQP